MRELLKGYNINEDEVNNIILYIEELIMWNKKINLVSRSEPLWIIEELIIPVVKIKDWIEYGDVVEIGAGSGIVSVVLNILNKNARFLLIERREKKCVFLRYIKKKIGLDFKVLCKDVKEKDFKYIFDYLILRGVKLEKWHLNIAKKIIYFGKTDIEPMDIKMYKNIIASLIKGNV